uniref:Uncharacterized protein n=1 Tax=Eutreptiella gymnastica TaxID=73025 RepID=A0A7S4CM76_9EUGL
MQGITVPSGIARHAPCATSLVHHAVLSANEALECLGQGKCAHQAGIHNGTFNGCERRDILHVFAFDFIHRLENSRLSSINNNSMLSKTATGAHFDTQQQCS